MLIKDANILMMDGSDYRGDIFVKNGSIARIGHLDGRADIDAKGRRLIPGLVDIHSHGAMNCDGCDASDEGLHIMADFYAKNGVTSFCVTSMTYDEDTLTRVCKTARDFKRTGGAKCAGINMEGPFISYAKRGAQNPAYLHEPDFAMFMRLNDASGGLVRLIDIAPELPGSMDFIRRASQVTAVSLAHTEADYDCAMEAFDAGASHVTHLFNAMPTFLHRAPGVIGAAADAGAYVEVICDGIHLHPSVIRSVFKLFGGELVCLISDSMRCAGLPDGDYELGGQPVFVRGGKATLSDGTIAGSSINLMAAVRNAVRFGVPFKTAVFAATVIPARSIGMADRLGVIAEGRAADMVLLSDALDIDAVIVDGQIIS